MIIVRVPRWAATSEQFTIPVEVEQNMPAAAKTHPIELNISGFELIWAAVRSGRPAQFLKNPHSASNAEFAQWRATSCLRLLEPDKPYLRRPEIFHSEVDPSEKGYLNFMLGGTLTMAYLANKLGIRWLAHYSLVEKSPNYHIIKTSPSKVEPDYIGMDKNQQFFAAEAKGRMSLDKHTKLNLQAKRQTKTVKSVNGQASLHGFGIAAISGGQKIELYATDPEVEINLPTPNEWVRRYYEYVRAVCGPEGGVIEASQGPENGDWVRVSLDLPRTVSQWALDAFSPGWGKPQRHESSWDRLAQSTHERAKTEGGDVLPDLTIATPLQRD